MAAVSSSPTGQLSLSEAPRRAGAECLRPHASQISGLGLLGAGEPWDRQSTPISRGSRWHERSGTEPGAQVQLVSLGQRLSLLVHVSPELLSVPTQRRSRGPREPLCCPGADTVLIPTVADVHLRAGLLQTRPLQAKAAAGKASDAHCPGTSVSRGRGRLPLGPASRWPQRAQSVRLQGAGLPHTDLTHAVCQPLFAPRETEALLPALLTEWKEKGRAV